MMMARLGHDAGTFEPRLPADGQLMNSLASAFCILFMFWTITHLGRRI